MLWQHRSWALNLSSSILFRWGKRIHRHALLDAFWFLLCTTLGIAHYRTMLPCPPVKSILTELHSSSSKWRWSLNARLIYHKYLNPILVYFTPHSNRLKTFTKSAHLTVEREFFTCLIDEWVERPPTTLTAIAIDMETTSTSTEPPTFIGTCLVEKTT